MSTSYLEKKMHDIFDENSKHYIHGMFFDIRIADVIDKFKAVDPTKSQSSDIFFDARLKDMRKDLDEALSSGGMSEENRSVLTRYTKPELVYNIYYDFVYCLEKYEKYHPEIRETNGKYTASIYPQVSLHITHNDADAYGCAATTILASSLRNTLSREHGPETYQQLDIIINATAGESNQYIVMAALMWFYYFDCSYPHRLIISDLDARPEVLDAVMSLFDPEILYPFSKIPSNDAFFDYKSMAVLYVDHHATNSYMTAVKDAGGIDKCTGLLRELKDFVCVANTISESIEWINKIYEDCFMNQYVGADSTVCIIADEHQRQRAGEIRIDNYKDAKVSAALLLWSFFRPWFQRLHQAIPDGDDDNVNRANALRGASAKSHIIQSINRFQIAVSQWDTFEWRDHPDYNVGTELDLAYAEAGSAGHTIKYYLFDRFYELAYVFDKRVELGYMYNLYPDSIRECKEHGEFVLNAEVDYMLKHYKKCTLEDIVGSIMQFNFQNDMSGAPTDEEISDKIAEIERLGTLPRNWVITTYPHLGGISLINEIFLGGAKGNNDDLDEYGIISYDESSTLVSFRTKSKSCVVNSLPKYYGGGGHPQAAGIQSLAISYAIRTLYLQLCAKKR